MQPSIPWSSSVSVFVIERTAIIHSLKCTVPFSLVVPLLSLAVTHCYLLSLVVTRCITRCHALSLVAPLVVIPCHSLSFVVTRCLSLSLVVFRCHSLYHSMSLVVIRCHSLSLYVPLICLFINDSDGVQIFTFCWVSICLTSKISKETWQMVIWSENVFKENFMLQFSWLEEFR